MAVSSLTLANDNALSCERVRQIDRLNLQLILDLNCSQLPQNHPTLIDILDWKWVSNQLLDELNNLVHLGRGAAQWRLHVIEQEILKRQRKGERRRRSRLGGAKTGSQEARVLTASLVWKDCRRIAQLVSRLNSSLAAVGSGSSFKLRS
ncbi:hypothetical protein PGT21_000976 [Puccinia graminis f. sp. tritici]|uniref:Uncharacterized protein n=1 Tax=Puccinia graminis f. sp. tritici TaxID=56615 RepID=A0A5B0NTW5_PUCGR|nr:hypothetical protein PGT21_000976 [Puccinia graminis f. sp. tritici]